MTENETLKNRLAELKAKAITSKLYVLSSR